MIGGHGYRKATGEAAQILCQAHDGISIDAMEREIRGAQLRCLLGGQMPSGVRINASLCFVSPNGLEVSQDWDIYSVEALKRLCLFPERMAFVVGRISQVHTILGIQPYVEVSFSHPVEFVVVVDCSDVEDTEQVILNALDEGSLLLYDESGNIDKEERPAMFAVNDFVSEYWKNKCSYVGKDIKEEYVRMYAYQEVLETLDAHIRFIVSALAVKCRCVDNAWGDDKKTARMFMEVASSRMSSENAKIVSDLIEDNFKNNLASIRWRHVDYTDIIQPTWEDIPSYAKYRPAIDELNEIARAWSLSLLTYKGDFPEMKSSVDAIKWGYEAFGTDSTLEAHRAGVSWEDLGDTLKRRDIASVK